MSGSGIMLKNKKLERKEVKEKMKRSMVLVLVMGLVFTLTQTAFCQWGGQPTSTPTATGTVYGFVLETYKYTADGILLSSTNQYGEVTLFTNGRIKNIKDALGNIIMQYIYKEGILDSTVDIHGLVTKYTNGRRMWSERQDQTDTGQITLVKVFFHYGADGLLETARTCSGTGNETNDNLIRTTYYKDGREKETKNKEGTIITQFFWNGANLLYTIDPTNDDSYKTVYRPDGEVSYVENKEGTKVMVMHFDAQGRRSSRENGVGETKIITKFDTMGRESYAKDSAGTIVRYWVYNGNGKIAVSDTNKLMRLDPDNVDAFLAALQDGGKDDGKLDYIVNVAKFKVDKKYYTYVNTLERFNNDNHGINFSTIRYTSKNEPKRDPAFSGRVAYQDGQFYLILADGTRLKLLQSSANHHGPREGNATLDLSNWFSTGRYDPDGTCNWSAGERQITRASLESYLRSHLGKSITLIGNIDGAGNLFVICAGRR